MDAPATYLHWAFILISVPNLIVLGAMIVIFIAALLAPFPHGEGDPEPDLDRDQGRDPLHG